MQISVEETSELGRKMIIQLPEEAVQKDVNKRLQSMLRDIKLPGFRPGKVPLSLVKKRYGKSVRNEVIGELVRSSFSEAINEKKLSPAAPAEIEPLDTEKGDGVEFVARFDVLPKVELTDLSQLEIKRPVTEIQQSDLDAVIDKLREQKKTWHSVERAAESGDRVTIHFTGKTEAGPFTKEKVENFPVILGSESMVPGFEGQLNGVESEQNLSFDLEFPEEYGDEALAGKTATFDVEVVKIEASELPDIDEALIKSFGVEDGAIESFHEQITENLQYQTDELIKSQVKAAVIDALLEQHTFPVPESMVAQEAQGLYASAQTNANQQGQTLQMTEEEIQTEFASSAGQRVKISMIFEQIFGVAQLVLDTDRVGLSIERLAENYQDSQSVVEHYNQDTEARNQIESMILEEQLIEWVMEQVKVVDEPVEFNDLIPPTA